MKRLLAILTILAISSVAWAAVKPPPPGNVVGDEYYHDNWGYRDWQQYEGTQELADGYWGISSVRDISLRYVPATTVDFNAVRLAWKGGGSASDPPIARPVSVWIESSTPMANYHNGIALDGSYDPEPWEIPSGVQISPQVGTVNVTASDMVTDHFVGQMQMIAGQIYHIRVSVPAHIAEKDKLRLRMGSIQPNKAYLPLNNNYNNNTNYRNADGVCGCNLSPATNKVDNKYQPGQPGCGSDCMAVLHMKDIIDPFGDPQPYNQWVEGEIWNDGIEDYTKYHEPRFELLDYDWPIGLGQGTDAQTHVAVPSVGWYGEEFRLDPCGAGCSPPELNPPEFTDKLRMYIRKVPGAVGNLHIGLFDSAGIQIASGSRTAASIPDFHDQGADGSPTTDWGWVTVTIPTVGLAPGATYQVKATADNDGEYELYQQDFNLGGLEINSTAGSYQGAVGHAVAPGNISVPDSDVLFLIPEPATMSLLVLGGLAALLKRRRR